MFVFVNIGKFSVSCFLSFSVFVSACLTIELRRGNEREGGKEEVGEKEKEIMRIKKRKSMKQVVEAT